MSELSARDNLRGTGGRPGSTGWEAFQQAFVEGVIATAIVAPDGRLLHVNPALTTLTGYSEAELLASSYDALIHPDERESLHQDLRALLDGEAAALEVEQRAIGRDGRERWIELSMALVRDDAGVPCYVIAQFVDISRHKQFEDQLLQQAFHDPLTGLPNRWLFMDRLEHALARGQRSDETIAVIFLDLDNFKVINDSLGHRAGDQLLLLMADRLQLCVREGDTVARLGGDEFTILLEQIDDVGTAVRVAQRILEQSLTLYAIGDRQVAVTASVGIALATADQESADDLLRNADIAMYEAKRRGRARYEIFTPPMNVRARQRLDLEIELQQAIERGEFTLHYQPVVNLSTGRIGEIEALVRWRHPTRGLLAAAEFVPIADETGLVLDIGGWALRRACRQLQRWQREIPTPGSDRLSMSVNLSRRQFVQPSLVADVRAVLTETGVDPHLLTMEVTEQTVMDDAEAAVVTFRELKALGVRLTIDDFGTGYSSLAYLKRFAVDSLKIDSAFTTGISRNPEDTAIVEAILGIGRSLGISVDGKGIERRDQLTFLHRRGCASGQGHLFSQPLPPDEMTEFLRAQVRFPLPTTYASHSLLTPESP